MIKPMENQYDLEEWLLNQELSLVSTEIDDTIAKIRKDIREDKQRAKDTI